MEQRPIGSLTVSEIGLGCNTFGSSVDAGEAAAIVDEAIDSGITFFDTSDSYGGGASEELLGRSLGHRRGEVVLATKFGIPIDEARPGGARPEYVRTAVDSSLRRLGTDWIDLYQLHIPDPDVPIEETLGALSEVAAAGKVREIGCSNFAAEELRAAAEAPLPDGARRFASVQNEYSLVRREPESSLLPECGRLGVAFIPYYPLAGGLLTGKYRRGDPPPEGSRYAPQKRGASFGRTTPALVASLREGRLPRIPRRRDILSEPNYDLVESLTAFAERRGRTLLELAFAWLLRRPEVASVIAGATRPEQVRANAVAPAWRMSPDELAEVGSILARAA
jgi:aryl-alcohol dehydrogenase-like predicted oxidoreductase